MTSTEITIVKSQIQLRQSMRIYVNKDSWQISSLSDLKGRSHRLFDARTQSTQKIEQKTTTQKQQQTKSQKLKIKKK